MRSVGEVKTLFKTFFAPDFMGNITVKQAKSKKKNKPEILPQGCYM